AAPPCTFPPVRNSTGPPGHHPPLPKMSAPFRAAGPDVGHGTLPLVHNIDVAPTIEHLLGVQPAATVQGTAINLATPSTPPVAQDDSFTVARNAPPTRLDVLANDSAAIPGGQLGVLAVGPAQHGQVQVSGDGRSVLYTPDPNFSGPDSFTYAASNTVRVADVPRQLLGAVNGVNIYDGFGSALAAVPGTTDEFYSLTDRGPNVDGPGGGKVFALPDFTPQIGRFKLADGALIQVGTILLRDANGNPLNGLPD